MSPAAVDPGLASFADEVGADGPVTVVGGRTQWSVGGTPGEGAREVRAPVGIVEVEPAEMTVRVRAGTPVRSLLDALAEVGQLVPLPAREGATVGGLLAVGRSDSRRLGLGPVRDAVLEIRYVSADGHLVRAGGPTVKNVSGFDLCRLFVGSLGTLGFAAEVVLRTHPVPEASVWLAGSGADPFAVLHLLHAPRSVLWDGDRTWVLLEGREADVADQTAVVDRWGLVPVAGPPDLPEHRSSHDPGALRSVVEAAEGRLVVEVGVGVAHREIPVPPPAVAPGFDRLHQRVRAVFDPRGRLNPGRDPRRP